MSDRCRNVMDRGVSVHIPGCMGCAASGHENCTCGSKRPPLLIRRLEKLERRVKKLEAKLNAQERRVVSG